VAHPSTRGFGCKWSARSVIIGRQGDGLPGAQAGTCVDLLGPTNVAVPFSWGLSYALLP